MRNKAAVGADLYVEDSPDNIEQLRTDGHSTIVFSNSTNRHLAGPRADSWEELERFVLDELASWNTSIKTARKKLSGE